MSARTHTDRAIAAAITALGSPHPTTAAVALFIAAARHMNAVVDDKRVIAELAYQIADDIVEASNK
jgi:hypothetical protein